MQELRRICDRHGIMLVVDEVQSGIGRTGKWLAVEHTGVEPDMVCMAKGIASGMPLGITMTPRGNHGLGSGIARIDFRRQSGRDRGGAGHAGCDREGASARELGAAWGITC